MPRRTCASGPVTRNATGKGEYGPNTSWVARSRASGARPSAIFCLSRSLSASRASALAVRMTILAKEGSGSSGDIAKKKRGAPWPM